MKKKPPVCAECQYMKLTGWAKLTANSWGRKGPRGDCTCNHPAAEETFRKMCPRGPRMPGFIGFTAPGESVPQTKTAPRWCPLRFSEV